MKAKVIGSLLVLSVVFGLLAGLFNPAVAFAAEERYLVTNQGTITNGTGVITESPADLVIGTNVVHVTTSGTFTIFLASGTTGTATGSGDSGNCALNETPVSLVAGSNVIQTENPTGHLTITLVAGSDVYWEDVNSWSTTSGGIAGAPFPAAFPDQDDVYFDANSFPVAGTTLHIDSIETDVYCNNFDWTGVTNNPTLVGNAAQFVVVGDILMSENMTASSFSPFLILAGSSSNISIRTKLSSTALVTYSLDAVFTLQAPYSGP